MSVAAVHWALNERANHLLSKLLTLVPDIRETGRNSWASRHMSWPLWLTKFLKRATNSGKAVIKGKRVNRGGGYGLEVPCEYRFTGDSFSINWLKTKLTKEGFDVKQRRVLSLRNIMDIKTTVFHLKTLSVWSIACNEVQYLFNEVSSDMCWMQTVPRVLIAIND